MTPSRLRGIAALCVSYVALFLWVLRPLWDIDIFLHIAVGRYLLAHGVPSTDVFSSAAPEAAWTPFQVGYALLMAELDKLAGLDGIRVVDAALTALALLIALGRFHQITQRRIATFLLFAILLFLYDDRIRPRPHLFNLLFEVSLLLPIARGALAVGNRRWLLGLFAAGAAWAFMHAMGALWLVAVLGTWLVAGRDSDRRWAALAIGSTLAGIALAPGAAGGIVHVLRIQDQWMEFVPELAPTWAFFGMHNAYGYVMGTMPWLAVLTVLYAAAQKPARDQWPALLCAAGFAFSSLWLARLCYYVPFALALVWPTLRSTRLARLPRAPLLAAAVGCALCLLIVAHVLPRFSGRGVNPWTTTLYPGAFPVQEVDALAATGRSARAYNDMQWGGYLLYRLFPRMRVISDARVTFTPEVAELLRHEKDTAPEIVAEVAYRRFGIDLLLWRRGRMPQTPHWRLLVRGSLADVWVRTP